MSRHAGEISFPGGLPARATSTCGRTALRETAEELGIEAAPWRCSARCPDPHLRLGTLVTPFVALGRGSRPLVLNDAEIAAVTCPCRLRELDAVEEQRVLREDDGTTWRGWWYERRLTVWGATGSCSTRCWSCFGRRRRGPLTDRRGGELRAMLGEVRTIAVVGLSSGPAGRPTRSRATSRARLPHRAGQPERDRGAGRARIPVLSSRSRTTWDRCRRRVPPRRAHAGGRARRRRDRREGAVAPGGHRERGGPRDRRPRAAST